MSELAACYGDSTDAPTFEAMAKAAARAAQHKLGERMKALREDRKESQEAAADRIGISQKYLSELERGEKSPSWETLVAIAHKGYDIKLASLMFGIDEDIGAEARELNDVLAGRSKAVRYDVLRAVELILKAAEASK